MEYVSLEKSRAGWQPDSAKKQAGKKPAPKTSADPAASTTPDDGASVSKHEED